MWRGEVWFDILTVVDSSVWVSLGSGCKYNNSNMRLPHTRHRSHLAILKAMCIAVAGAPSHTFISQNISCKMISFHYSIRNLIQTVSVGIILGFYGSMSWILRSEVSFYSFKSQEYSSMYCTRIFKLVGLLTYFIYQLKKTLLPKESGITKCKRERKLS